MPGAFLLIGEGRRSEAESLLEAAETSARAAIAAGDGSQVPRRENAGIAALRATLTTQ